MGLHLRPGLRVTLFVRGVRLEDMGEDGVIVSLPPKDSLIGLQHLDEGCIGLVARRGDHEGQRVTSSTHRAGEDALKGIRIGLSVLIDDHQRSIQPIKAVGSTGEATGDTHLARHTIENLLSVDLEATERGVEGAEDLRDHTEADLRLLVAVRPDIALSIGVPIEEIVDGKSGDTGRLRELTRHK